MAQLDAALARQQESGRPLGQVLLEMGLITTDTLVQVLGQQFRLEPREIDPYLVPLDAIAALPRQLAEINEAFPLEILPSGALALAVVRPPSPKALMDLERAAGRAIELYLASQGDLDFAIRRGFERLEGDVDRRSVGHVLVEQGLLAPEQFAQAARQRRQGYARLGEVLVREGLLTPARLGQAETLFASQPQPRGRFGDFLVARGLIRAEELRRALAVQDQSCPPLGEMLHRLGLATPDQLDAAARVLAAETGKASTVSEDENPALTFSQR